MAAETTAMSSAKNLPDNSDISWAEQAIANTTQAHHGKDVGTLFLRAPDEARRFLAAVYEIHQAIKGSTEKDSSKDSVVRTLHLMDVAMNWLMKEFASVLKHGRDGKDSFQSATLEYIQAAAECMMVSGYTAECVEIYRKSRRAVVEDSLSRLGVERVSSSQVQKLNWDSLDLRITQWLAASHAEFGEIFSRERKLCGRIFSSSESIGDSCFAEITTDPAVEFFRFPHVIASKNKKRSEEVLHYLSMFRSVRQLVPEVQATFPAESAKLIKSQADASLHVLSHTVRSMIADFESMVQKEPPISKSAPLPAGGDLHALTKVVLEHLVPLAGYADTITELLGGDPGSRHSSATDCFAWLLTTLLCKLDVKAELYKDVSESYLFLINNIQYAVNKVRESKLAELLGPEWLSSHENKARSFARSFLRLAWKKVLEVIPDDLSAIPGVEARECMLEFNKLFEEACKSHAGWVVLDDKIREEIKAAVEKKLVSLYQPFYERCRSEMGTEDGRPSPVVRFAPQDLVNRLSGFYCPSQESPEWAVPNSPRYGGSVSGGSSKGIRWRWLRETRSRSVPNLLNLA